MTTELKAAYDPFAAVLNLQACGNGPMVIRHKTSGEILFEDSSDSLKETLENAVRSGADLTGANLRGADLRGANLTEANLRLADLSNAIQLNTNLGGKQ